MRWKISEVTQYGATSMDYSRMWPQNIFEEQTNTVNLVGILTARKFTAFPKYDHEGNMTINFPLHTLESVLFQRP